MTLILGSLTVKELDVQLTDENGLPQPYKLRELTGKLREQFLDILQSKAEIGPDGKPKGIKSVKGLHGGLLSLSLYDREGKLVPIDVIEGWPARIVEPLFDAAQELSKTTLESATQAGNS